ncbi:chromosome segregation protein [Purpureocillium lilacinum]|uniref:Chromosome segregation protein n=1 Tax=Purpureocillium lilacinum TaxID=33203 RepID=A0A2U3EFW5_PURLI|nr:chromosome segregation protein [Purpureocillium lilacinum]
MSPPTEATIPATRRTRKSIGAHTDIRKAMDKENATVDVGSSLAANRKKSRSKSMGPGGLDALKQGHGNRRASLAAPIKPPRSILKPTISALPEIPPLKKGGRGASSSGSTRDSTSTASSGEDSSSKIAVRTEEEQQAAAREREERERRDARRKSLANRRVSFAAEATLHTFHEVEYMQDSTTSTDSSRRASAAGKSSEPPTASQREETPQAQIDTVPDSPDDQRELHQRKRRRSSGLPSMNFGPADDDTIASTIYSSDSEPADAVEEIEEEEDDGSSSDSDGGTMMTMEEVTGTTVASERSVGAHDDSTLDEALRMAAHRAGTQNLGSDQDDDFLDDGEEVIPSFGWVKKPASSGSAAASGINTSQPSRGSGSNAGGDGDTAMDIDMDMDMTNAVGRILKPSDGNETDHGEDMSMDVTQAFGGILSHNKGRAGPMPSEAQESAPMDEATMEFTTALGGIHRSQDDELEDVGGNEDMSMELTTVMGGVLSQSKGKKAAESRRRTLNRERDADLDDATMDMTTVVGRIIPQDNNAADEGMTMGMDMTTAIGGIINRGEASPRTINKRIMEEEASRPNSPKGAIIAAVSQKAPSRRSSRNSLPASAPPPESPGLSAFRGKGLRRSMGPEAQSTPRQGAQSRTPSPAKSATPQRKKSVTPSRGPGSRTKTPDFAPKNPQSPVIRTPSPEKPKNTRTSFFQSDPKTGSRTPTIVLTPQKRPLSGVGVDRPGLGSPQVAAVCDRRSSIGDAAGEFVLGKRAVAFADPKEMEEELDRERRDDEDKENRRKILEREADGSQEDKDATFNLREMIDSLSPKRNPLKGRKSLHMGSARGLLGKRPVELDDDEEAEENDGVKRLKGHQSSPVKNVRLQQPPSKAETTGRLTRSARRSLEQGGSANTPSLSSPLKEPATTPRRKGHFKDVKDNHTVHEVNFQDTQPKDDAELEKEADDERIHLQDFLNMTSIRFMELTTTKRRHTVAPGSLQDGSTADGQDSMSLERCVVAGACTVPMLELYQHSCRELKKYISEGRRMVKEIENDTFEDNPPLFREYMSATPDVKALMDNQFKNVKTHARFLSKAMWYEWRMKLQDGLKEGLVGIAEGMESDDQVLKQQEDLLASVLPDIVKRYEALDEESNNLQEVARELADCDPAELQAARNELSSLESDIAQKKRMIAELRQQFDDSSADVEVLAAKKQHCLEEIEKSEKIREECRGWTSSEVNTLKARVETIEKKHGWAVTGLSGTTLSMTYKREIELVFDIASFQPHQPNSRIDLWYIADIREHNPVPKTAEIEFFLQCMRDGVRALPQSRTKMSAMLDAVRSGWDTAQLVAAQIRRVNITFPTTVIKTSDSSIAMTSSLLLKPLETRVEITLNLHGRSDPTGLGVGISAEARVVYGENFNVDKVGEFLMTRIGDTARFEGEDWSNVVVELQQRLIARGRK